MQRILFSDTALVFVDLQREFAMESHYVRYLGYMWVQVVRIQIALANGTLWDATPESSPWLWKAAQVCPSQTGSQAFSHDSASQ
jgi:hypothetical protein